LIDDKSTKGVLPQLQQKLKLAQYCTVVQAHPSGSISDQAHSTPKYHGWRPDRQSTAHGDPFKDVAGTRFFAFSFDCFLFFSLLPQGTPRHFGLTLACS